MKIHIPIALLLLASLSGCAIPLAPTEDAVDQHQDFFSEAEREEIRKRARIKRQEQQSGAPTEGGGGH